MGIEGLLAEVIAKAPWLMLVLSGLGSLVVVGQAVVLITPSKKDDEVLEGLEKNSIVGAILGVLKKFAVIQKK